MHSVKNTQQSGFSLVELMVVVAIIGILASVAAPRFSTFQARARQAEPRGNLNGVYLAVQSYVANYGAFPDIASATNPETASIGFGITGSKKNYDYFVISSSTDNKWAAGARSVSNFGSDKDLMRINANKWLCSPYDAVSKTAATAAPTATSATGVKDCPESVSAGSTASWQPILKDSDLAQ